MKQDKPTAGIFIVLGLLAFAPVAHAAPLTFHFGGVIDFVEDGLPISNQVVVGMAYSASYLFDPVGVEDTSDLPITGRYLFETGFLSVSIGALNMTTPDLLVFIENSTLLDRYLVSAGSPFDAHSISWQGMGLDLRDATHTAFDSDALPLTAPNLDDFQLSKRFSMRQPDRRDPSITGTVDFLTMIPEPSSVAILLTGVALVAGRRRHSNS